MLERFVSFFGLLVFIGLAWLLSSRRDRVPWRLVLYGTLLQFAFAWLVLKSGGVFEAVFRTESNPVQIVFQGINDLFVAVIGCADAGAAFLFGPQVTEERGLLNNFAFRALPVIIFFSSLMSVLYYLGAMQWVVRGMAWVMQKTLRTSGAETLSCAANVFVGQTEAPLVIRPYLADMTRSELMAVMVGGFATVAGSVMAVYVRDFHVSAAHLLTASIISAPAALVIAKIMLPEVDEPKTLGTVKIEAPAPTEAANIIHAASIGAADGAKLAINVGAMLIAFLALIALVDLGLGALGRSCGYLAEAWFSAQINTDWSLQAGLGYVFLPIAWLLGTEPADCLRMGELLGIKMVGNEFLAYDQLHKWLPEDGPRELSERSEVLATYALCGFANFGSIGIQIGGIGSLVPPRRAELAQLGLRAMVGGTLACNMTACVAGMLL